VILAAIGVGAVVLIAVALIWVLAPADEEDVPVFTPPPASSPITVPTSVPETTPSTAPG
jgi:hypothetical protein